MHFIANCKNMQRLTYLSKQLMCNIDRGATSICLEAVRECNRCIYYSVCVFVGDGKKQIVACMRMQGWWNIYIYVICVVKKIVNHRVKRSHLRFKASRRYWSILMWGIPLDCTVSASVLWINHRHHTGTSRRTWNLV